MNSIHASAERAFDPSLEGKPLIVLSNNAGCAVTRSAEAKALGIPMVELWGVAGALTKRLHAMGIKSILDLKNASPVMIRDKFSVVFMGTVLELQGIPCIPMEEERMGLEQLSKGWYTDLRVYPWGDWLGRGVEAFELPAEVWGI